MARGKYNSDYRLVEEFRADGKVRTDYEYIGDHWFFHSDAETLAGAKKKALAFVALAAAAFVAALLPYTGMMHKPWIALPFAVCAVPIFMMGDLVLNLQKWKEPMEHRMADKLNNSYPARSLAIAYLSLASIAAEIVYLVLYGFAADGDKVMLICTGVMLWSALMLFRQRGVFKAEVRKQQED